jgi:hypothetical protein
MAGRNNTRRLIGRAFLRPLIAGNGTTRQRWARTPARGLTAR